MTHSGVGGEDVDVKTYSQRTKGDPVYPAGQEHTAECLTPVQIALMPQAFTHGSAHFLLIHALFPGQSSLTIHSG